MRYLAPVFTAIIMVAALSSCFYQDGKRNVEFAPNMYHSIPLEPYSQIVDDWNSQLVNTQPQTIFKDGLNAQSAPAGTVPRTSGTWYHTEETYAPYHLPNTTEGYELSATTVTSPLDITGYTYQGTPVDCSQESFERGKKVYEVYCTMCHGATGQGNGSLAVKGNKPFEGIVPSYTSAEGTGLKNLPAGKMFHSITYGKGVMGSYASQVTPRQRWEVICYIQHFQRKGN